MNSTPVSLLERLRQPAAPDAWERFVELYTPLLYYWSRRAGLQESDAADLVQDVLTVLVEKLPGFHLDPHKSFRSWLRTITLNKWRDLQRRRAVRSREASGDILDAVPASDEADGFAEAEFRREVVGRALELMQRDFAASTWKACWEMVVGGRSAAEVAAELGLREGTVYAAKSRVLQRLRQELAGMLD